MENLKQDAVGSISSDVKTATAAVPCPPGSEPNKVRSRNKLRLSSRLNLHAIRSSPLVSRASWTLVNQGIVSGGNFALNIILARNLGAADYGTFVLFLGAIYFLRTVDYSFISYPLSIRLHVSPIEAHPSLLGSTILLCAPLCLGLAALFALSVALLGREDLVLPVLACYLGWQSQETMRRCLLADFRYRAAMLGDATAYVVQPIILAFAAHFSTLSVGHVLYFMSITFVLGALLHASRLNVARPDLSQIRELAREYVSLGKWSFINYEVVLVRLQFFPWALAASLGTAAAASFQAALNIANIINPITLGIGNAVPQAAAHAYHSGGAKAALKVSRHYTLFGLPPVILICLGGLLAPELLLRIFYGAQSSYLDYSLAVQLACLAGGAEYVAEMLNKTLLGVRSGRLALLMNSVSFGAALLTLPLILKFGATGACLGLALANVARLLAGWGTMNWLVRKDNSHDRAEGGK